MFEKRYSPFSVIVGTALWLMPFMAFVIVSGQGIAIPERTPTVVNGVPTLGSDLQNASMTLQLQIAGLAHAQAVLQKESDALTVQLQRTLQQAQAVCAGTPGYELSTVPTLACRPKPKDVAKKDEPVKKE